MKAATITWEIGEDEPDGCLSSSEPRVPRNTASCHDSQVRPANEQHLAVIGAFLITIICLALVNKPKIEPNAHSSEMPPFPDAVAIRSGEITIWCTSDDAAIVSSAAAMAGLQHAHIRQMLGMDEPQQERHFVLTLDLVDSLQTEVHSPAVIIPPAASVTSSERIDYIAQAIVIYLVDDLLVELMGPAADQDDWSAVRTGVGRWLLQNGYPQLSPDQSLDHASHSDFVPATASTDKRAEAQLSTSDATAEIEKSISRLVALHGFPIVAELLRRTVEHAGWESLVSAVVSEQP